jgi:amidase
MAGPLPQEAAGWRLDLDPGSVLHDVRGLRVATVFGEGADVVPIASDVRANLDSFAARVAEAGAQVDAVALPVPLADGFASWWNLVGPIFGLGLPDDEYAHLASLENVPGDDPSLDSAKLLTSRFRSWMRATELRERQRAAWAQFFEQYDVVLAPVMPTAAFPHDTEGPMDKRLVDIDGSPVPYKLAAWDLTLSGVCHPHWPGLVAGLSVHGITFAPG